MAEGWRGPLLEFAIGLLMKAGAVHGAARFVPIEAAYTNTTFAKIQSHYDFLTWLADEGAEVVVPTYTNVGIHDPRMSFRHRPVHQCRLRPPGTRGKGLRRSGLLQGSPLRRTSRAPNRFMTVLCPHGFWLSLRLKIEAEATTHQRTRVCLPGATVTVGPDLEARTSQRVWSRAI
ncbi:MAG: hypothetical protein CMM46_14980 [Rhodospirillaceae bacterium]|mgnify:CR=1 FL=1|nr:hypothetical protein [Rhodospirillaceae bacterium]